MASIEIGRTVSMSSNTTRFFAAVSSGFYRTRVTIPVPSVASTAFANDQYDCSSSRSRFQMRVEAKLRQALGTVLNLARVCNVLCYAQWNTKRISGFGSIGDLLVQKRITKNSSGTCCSQDSNPNNG